MPMASERKRPVDDATIGGEDVDISFHEDKKVRSSIARKSVNTKQLEEIPSTAHYQISFMHKAIVTHLVSSTRHGYVVTACEEGIVKFWKRTAAAIPDDNQHPNHGTIQKGEEPSTPCLEFVKSFTAHIGPLAALCLDPSEDTIASIGRDDGMIKFYDVSTFDATAMIKTTVGLFGRAATFLHDSSKELLLAISNVANGGILIYSVSTLELVQTLSLHSKPVTAMAYNSQHRCCVSGDEQGILEVWDCTEGTKSDHVVGAPCSLIRNQLEFPSKIDTDLYSLAKKKTYPRFISRSARYFVVYGADDKVRVFQLTTGRIVVRYDERLAVYENNSTIDSMEFGNRAAREREMEEQKDAPSQLVQIDPSEQYILVSTVIGIKIIDFQRNKMVKLIGKADASQLRFLSFCLCLGDAKMNEQMQLARGTGNSTAVGDKKNENNSLVVALAYHQRRFYVFSHVDPFQDPDGADDMLSSRDVWNEAPTAQDQLLVSDTGRIGGAQAAGNSKAILRTTMGDIHIKLFPEVSKTLENFCGHARSGYYDGVTFHRVISNFMLVSN
jgi:peptidylprolyl isomerase domain and WD repeat-containing protein 1